MGEPTTVVLANGVPFEIHPIRVVNRPGEGDYVVTREAVIKLEGIREVHRWTFRPHQARNEWRETGDHFLTIGRKGGINTYRFAERSVRDWTYDAIIAWIERRDVRPYVAPAGTEGGSGDAGEGGGAEHAYCEQCGRCVRCDPGSDCPYGGKCAAIEPANAGEGAA